MSEDIPLTDAFYDNPLEYLQNYVRNLNNEIFLSQYHLNNLYTLLLIGRNSPWDTIRGNSQHNKEEIDAVVSQKVKDVKMILESLSNVYEDKAKKNTINQIEKLMAILKSKKKSIYIEKDRNAQDYIRFQFLDQNTETGKNDDKKEEQAIQTEEIPKENMSKQKEEMKAEESPKDEKQGVTMQMVDNYNKLFAQNRSKQQQSAQSQQQQPQTEQKQKKLSSVKRQGLKQVFTIFYGIANLSNLSALALTNIIEHNSTERFIKFKMSQNYNMTIMNEDPLFFDRDSAVSSIPSDLFVQHVFPFLSASELFSVRGVCKEWMENVREAWHATFKREMYTQLLACEFCKDIEFFYKTIQLRNPFFQKLSLLIHALIQIIQWDNVYQAINTNTLTLQTKRILIIILRLTGEAIELPNLTAINNAFFDQHKSKLLNLKQRAMIFFSSLSGSDMNINDLRIIKTLYLDDPFMRVQEINSEDKSPLLLTLFAKQMTLQQILRNHIFLCQQYLLNTKKRLDNVSKKMVYQKGYLQGVYKILLLKSSVQPLLEQKQQSEAPNFHGILESIFSNRNSDKPDFVIHTRGNSTEVFLDNATKLDLILATAYSNSEERRQTE